MSNIQILLQVYLPGYFEIILTPLIIYTLIIFSISCYKRDNRIAMVGYGGYFFLITASMLYYFYKVSNTLTNLRGISILVSILIAIWSIRLIYTLYQRYKTSEEPNRLSLQRAAWERKGSVYYLIRSFFQLFALRAIAATFISLPLFLSYTGPYNQDYGIWPYVGSIIWMVGFYFEFVSDAQLNKWKSWSNENKGQVMNKGLWKYSRHPNYFGEILIWTGISLIPIASSLGNFDIGIYSLVSPIIITIMLLKLTGINIIENKFNQDVSNLDWQRYKKRTSKLLPVKPKRGM